MSRSRRFAATRLKSFASSLPPITAWATGEVFTVTMLLIFDSSSAKSPKLPSGASTRLVGDDVPDACSGQPGLGERAEVDDPPIGVEGLESRQAVDAVGREQAVRVVLDQQQIMLGRDRQQPSPGLQVEAQSGRVGEVRHHVAGPWPQPVGPGGLHHRGQIVVLGNRQDGKVEQTSSASESDVRRGDREEDVVRTGAQSAEGEDHRLLAADRDDDRLGIDVDVFVDGEVAGDQVVHDALGPAVLEDRPSYRCFVVPL